MAKRRKGTVTFTATKMKPVKQRVTFKARVKSTRRKSRRKYRQPQMRRVLRWFLGLGPEGVVSNRRDLSAAKGRVVKELGLSVEDADAVLADLKTRGFIETVDHPRFSQLYHTRISDTGRQFVEGPRASTTVNIQGASGLGA